MQAWVPVKEVKTTMESEKEKEKEIEKEEEEKRCLEEQQQQQEEEDEKKNKKILSSLPSNYLTLNQLRENWLKKQHNEINQQKQQEEEDHRPLENRHVAVRFYADNRNRADSAINRHAIGVDDSDDGRKSVAGGVIGVDFEDGRKSVTGDAIGVDFEDCRKSATGGGNGDLNGKMEESKMTKKKNHKKNGWKKRKAGKGKAEEKGAIEEGSVVEENGISEETIMPIEWKEVKNSNSNTNEKAVDEVEENFRVLTVKSGNGKPNRRIKRMNRGVFRQSRNGGDGDSKTEMIWVRKDNNVGEIER